MAMLESDQEQLLSRLVEVRRSAPADKQSSFLTVLHIGGIRAEWIHFGLDLREACSYSDLRILEHSGLIFALANQSYELSEFDISPAGFEYYHNLRAQESQGLEHVEQRVQAYLESDSFRQRHESALGRWLEAERLLWPSEEISGFTQIGHLCRETMQEFATSALEINKTTDVNPDRSKTIDRMRSVLAARTSDQGDTTQAFLDALLVFWGTVHDMVQKQEHGAMSEGTTISWEDTRRVVFQTAIVMYEIDRSLGS